MAINFASALFPGIAPGNRPTGDIGQKRKKSYDALKE